MATPSQANNWQAQVLHYAVTQLVSEDGDPVTADGYWSYYCDCKQALERSGGIYSLSEFVKEELKMGCLVPAPHTTRRFLLVNFTTHPY